MQSLSDPRLSFWSRLTVYLVCAYCTGFFTGLILYFFIDLFVYDAIVRYAFKLEQIDAGIDSYMV